MDSTVGQGSRFTIHLPLTLAIVRAVLVQSGSATYVLPLGSVLEMLRLGDGAAHLRTLGGQPVISLRGRTIPLANLSGLLCGERVGTGASHIPEDAYVVVVGIGDRQVGLCVDALLGEQEVVIKSMGALLGDIPGLSGATILGDGKVALIVDVAKTTQRVPPPHAAASPHSGAVSPRPKEPDVCPRLTPCRPNLPCPQAGPRPLETPTLPRFRGVWRPKHAFA